MMFMEIFSKEIAGEWEVLVLSELPLLGGVNVGQFII